ncbi:MAG: glycosyltransferase family 2 protein [Microbacteriaceae bacterium]|nr:MAG: glycosyltransferase family 2 protein [Microbacteriaceae bacterium]
MSLPKVGVVTVTYNSVGVLDEFLRCLWAQKGVELHLYVIDNNSEDGTVSRLRDDASAESMTVIANTSNEGVAVGNNQGTEAAIADANTWVLLLNNDTVFDDTFVADLVANAMKHDSKILSPVIETTEPPGSVWYSDGRIQPFKAMKATHLGMGTRIPAELPENYGVDYASTCALLVAPTVFEEVGLMDPVYFVYGDDVDFCIRARKHGYEYRVAGNVLLTHKASSLTGDYTGPFAVRWISRNWIVVARRHATPIQLIVGLAYVSMWTVARFALRRDSLSVTRRRLKAFAEGWRLDLASKPPSLASGSLSSRAGGK